MSIAVDKNHFPKVSVIIAIYNTLDYLQKCMDSLLRQTYTNLEIILVDDGSTDGSSILLEKYAELDERICLFKQKNQGQSVARNTGLAQATGDYISFVDSDDWLDESYYEEMVEALQKAAADIAISSTKDHYSEKTIIHTFDDSTSVFAQTPSVCNKVFRRSLVIDEHFRAGIWYEDLHFFHHLLAKKPCITYASHVYYHCHCRSLSTMNNNNAEKNLDILTVFDDLFALYGSTCIEDGKMPKDYAFLLLDTLLITTVMRLQKMDNPHKKEIIEEMIHYLKKRFPTWHRSEAYRTLPRNRRIIAFLNAYVSPNISQLLVELKAKI